VNITAISIGFSGRYISNPVVTMVLKHINQLMGTTARRIITNIIFIHHILGFEGQKYPPSKQHSYGKQLIYRGFSTAKVVNCQITRGYLAEGDCLRDL